MTERMLLERGAEQAAVEAALRAAAGGTGSCLLLTGPLGIGRTALLDRLPELAGAGATRVLRAAAAPMEQDFPFGVVRQLLDGLPGADPVLDALDGLDALAAAGGEHDAHGEPDEHAVLQEIDALLARTGDDGGPPLLLLLDDLHWADTPSLRWLARLAVRPGRLRAVVVGTVRSGEPGTRRAALRELTAAPCRVLRPAALTPAATAMLVREHLGAAGTEESTHAFHAASAGNPLVLTCLLQHAAGGGPAGPAAPHPPRLTERVRACLRGLPTAERDLAAALCVLGEHAGLPLAARLAHLDEHAGTRALRALRELGLLTPAGPPRFVHDAVREAAAAGTSPDACRRLHESAADLLYEQGAPDTHVADQIMAAGGGHRPWSTAVLRAAARAARTAGAPQQAAGYLRRALQDHPEAGRRRAGLLTELAAAVRDTDAPAGARHAAQAALLPVTPADRALAVLQIPPAFLGTLPQDAAATLQRIAAELGPAALLKGVPREAALRLEARLRHARREDPAALAAAVERLRAPVPGPLLPDSPAGRELTAVLLNSAAVAGALPAGEVARLGRYVLEREPAAPRREHSALPLVVLALCAADTVEPAVSWLAAGQRVRAAENVPADAVDHMEQALVLLARGRLTHAREHAERVVDLAQARRGPAGASFAVVLAAVALEVRDPDFGARVLSLGAGPAPGLATTSMLQLLEAAAEAARGAWDAALETVLSSGRQLAAAGWHNSALFPWRPWAISLHHRLGDLPAARALADEEHERAARWGAPAVLGRALRLKGRLYEGPRGAALLREAVAVLRSSAHQLELARGLQALGRALGGGAEADAALHEAGELAVACGVPRLARRSGHEELDTAGGPAPASVLTPAERRVADLAGRGLTNQSIARELGVSARAVEKHLTNSYRKLGVRGRTEMIARYSGSQLGRVG
ncbi:AAA family ATPase [Streptomyces sp. NPDC049555]|uniref:AAA family ATPase n=1 Tax=Streptomyces sp. NPDC049555 TaxID=3154930 RepID=UPI003437D967